MVALFITALVVLGPSASLAQEATPVTPPQGIPEGSASPESEGDVDLLQPESMPESRIANDSFSTLAIAECEGVPGTQLSPSNSDFTFVDAQGNPISSPNFRENELVTLRFNWSLPGGANPCDYFVYQLPAGLGGATVAPFSLTQNGVAVGEATVAPDGTLTARFNDGVPDGPLVGSIQYSVRITIKYVEGQDEYAIRFSDTGVIYIKLGEGLGPPPLTIFRKDGWSYGRAHITWPDRGVFWRVVVPYFNQDIHNVVVTDALTADQLNVWEFNTGYCPIYITVYRADDPSKTNIPSLSETVTGSCTTDVATVSMPVLPAGHVMEFQMVGRLTAPNYYGPFYNTATLTANEIQTMTTPVQTIDIRGSGEVGGLVVPVNPTALNSTCVDGVYTAPSVTAASTTGVNYAISPNPIPSTGGAYTVTATVADGFAWNRTNAPASWTYVAATNSYVFEGTVTAEPCSSPPSPTPPTPGEPSPTPPTQPGDPSPTPPTQPGDPSPTPPTPGVPTPTPTAALGVSPTAPVKPAPTATTEPGVTPTAPIVPTAVPGMDPTAAPTSSVTGLPSTGTGQGGTYLLVTTAGVLALGMTGLGIRSMRTRD